MRREVRELAFGISRALISASSPTRSWTPSLDHTLHSLGCRNHLTPPLVAAVIDPFLLRHHSLALGFFNWASHQPNFSHTPFTFHSLLSSLSLSHSPHHQNAVVSLLKQAKTLNFPVHASILRSVIESLVATNKTHKAFSVFSEVCSLSDQSGSATCNKLLAALASEGYLESARKVFGEMTVRGVPFSTLGFGVFVWRICGEGCLQSVLAEVRECGSGINGSLVAVLIVHGLCRAGRVTEAVGMLGELRSRGWKPDFMAYWVVAAALRLMQDVAEEVKVLKMKRKLGVAPRAGDYRDFILELVSEGRINEAKELGEIIVGGKFPVEDDVLNVLIGSVSAIDPGAAIMFFNFMIEKERFPSIVTLSNLSQNLCRHSNVDELLEVFRVLDSQNYFKDVESYNVMVSFLCEAGRVKEGYAVLQEMRKKGIIPNVSSYNYVMEACCNEDLLRPARKLWDEMFSYGCCGNLKTFNILIKKFSEVGQTEEACKLFRRMSEKGLAPDFTTYTCVLEGLCQDDKLEAAFGLYNKSVKQDIILARDVLSHFVLSLCKKGYFMDASKLLRRLSHDIVHTESHVTLLKCLAEAKEISIAIEHLKLVQEKSPLMLQDICAGLLASLSSATCSESILQFLQKIHDVFDFPNKSTLKNLCHE